MNQHEQQHPESESNNPRGPNTHKAMLVICTLIPLLAAGWFGTSKLIAGSNLIASLLQHEDTSEPLYTFTSTTGSHAPDITTVAQSIHRHKIYVVFKHKSESNRVANDWEEFLTTNNIKNRICFYNQYRRCKLHSNVTAIIDLAHTQKPLLNRLYGKKSNILAFGFPENLNETVPGLTFADTTAKSSSGIAIVGDQLLTLGLDAGLHFNIDSLSDNKKATSTNPQAIAMFTTGRPGGSADARMHAVQHKNSRIVWADFTPAALQHLSADRRQHMESVLAGVLRYSTNQEYATIATWPSGHKHAAFLERRSSGSKDDNQRVSNFFSSNQYPLANYVQSPATDSDAVEAGLDHIVTTGEFFALVPDLKLTENSKERLTVIPRTGSDGTYLWDTLTLDAGLSLNRLENELSWVEKTGALYGFGFDVDAMADDNRFNVVQTLAHMLGNDTLLWMTTADEVASWWVFRHDLLTGVAVDAERATGFQPVLLAVDASGALKKTWFRATTTGTLPAVVSNQVTD